MKLVLPSAKYKLSYLDLLNSARKYGDYKELGNAMLRDNESYDDLLNRLKDRRNGINIASRDVAATVYFIVDNGDVVGTIDLRHKLNENYLKRLGHIAYYIKPEKRNKGYASHALSLAIEKYKQNNVDRILITCYSDNIASKRVIEKNGGVLEKEVHDEKSGKKISRYYVDVNNKIVKPSVAWLTTNRTCNNKCNWCYTFSCRDKIMDYNNAKKYIDELKKNDIKKVILIGGEPTIYDWIIDLVKYISENDIIVSMASNGRKFSDSVFTKKIVNAGLKNCNISIKGSDEDEYLKNTNSVGFNQMVSGFHNLKASGINVSTSYVLCDNNYDKFDMFLKAFINNKLDNLVFQLYKPSVDGEYDGAPSVNDLAQMCKYVFEKMENTNINYSFEMSIPLCCLDESVLNRMIDKGCITTCCHISKGKGIIFDTNFDILPCNHFVNHPLNKHKVDRGKVIDFWNSDNACDFRKIINTYPHDYCSKCNKWVQCGGGCFLRWLSSEPVLYINDKYVKDGD